jgi:O-antigen/teichoic acid export membrane protein
VSRPGLLRNVSYNLIGSVVPIVVTVFTIPIYIHMLGDARYGLVSLIWLTFGYFGIFDLGLSRAVAYRLASLRSQALELRTSIFFTACCLNVVLGLSSALAFYLCAGPLARHLTTDGAMQAEVLQALPLVAAFFPVGLLGGTFGGCLQADERFLELNLQQSVGAALFQCLPLAFMALAGTSLHSAILGAVIARTISVAWMGTSCLRWARSAGLPKIQLSHVGELFRYGGWITVSDVISPILNGLDQMLIGLRLGSAATAHYSVPFSMATKSLIIPGALCRAIFPRLSRATPQEARHLLKRLTPAVAGTMALMCVPGILLADAMLRFWIGDEFASLSHTSTSILLLGMWINGIAYLPFTYLQTQGRPDLIAKIHAIELLPFVVLLLALIAAFGLNGAAAAWCIRIAIDAILQGRLAGFRWRDAASAAMPGAAVCVALAISMTSPGLLAAAAWILALTTPIALMMIRDADLEGRLRLMMAASSLDGRGLWPRGFRFLVRRLL